MRDIDKSFQDSDGSQNQDDNNEDASRDNSHALNYFPNELTIS